MTREEAWTQFASSALAEVMPGSLPGLTFDRVNLAATWADAMTDEWAKRFDVKPAPVEEVKPRRKAG